MSRQLILLAAALLPLCCGCGFAAHANDADNIPPVAAQAALQAVDVQPMQDQRPPAAAAKHEEIKSPFLRRLMESLDAIEGVSTQELDLARKGIRDNDVLVDQALRSKWDNIRRANMRRPVGHVGTRVHSIPTHRELKRPWEYDPRLKAPKPASPDSTPPAGNDPRPSAPQ